MHSFLDEAKRPFALFCQPLQQTAPRDLQDLMANPAFSISKTPRTTPIEYSTGNIYLRVEAVAKYGMATIWDADIMIWAATHIVTAQNRGLVPSRHLISTPYEILKFLRRGVGLRDYQRLKAALDRLQSTTIVTSIRQNSNRRNHRFSWINEWREKTDLSGRPQGLEIIFPDWFFSGAVDPALVLTFEPSYFEISSGFERWLYRLIRKHGGKQAQGWRFGFRHLHAKSGSLSPYKRFCFELRKIIRRQPFSEYTLSLEVDRASMLWLAFEYQCSQACGQAVNPLVLSGTRNIVPSGTALSCYREPKQRLRSCNKRKNRAPNLDSNNESNLFITQQAVNSSSSKFNLRLKNRQGGRT